MKRIIMFVGIMLFIVGCVNLPSVEQKKQEVILDTVNITTDAQVVVVMTKYLFFFPESDWYLDFFYDDGFDVDAIEDGLLFKFYDGSNIVFKYGTTVIPFEGGEIYQGNGWVGQQKPGQIIFITPDEKYHVLISGEDEILKAFVGGLVMGK